MHPDQLLARITWPQFLEWHEYYNLEPWGEERADWRDEIFRRRFQWTLFGPPPGERLPDFTFPYIDPAGVVDPEQVHDNALSIESHLEPDGRGGYQWKEA